MAKIETLQTIAAGLAGNTTLNANMTKITTALNNTLSRDGSSPNSMSADIDMNSNKLINVADPTDNQDAATKAYIDALVLSGVPDGDKGDIVVSSNGTSWVFDSSVVTTFAKTLLDDANAAAMRTTLGLVIGTDVQGYDATLAALAGALTAANKIPYATATDTLGELDFKDEDNMASNSATALASQQSIKAYVDGAVASATLPDGDYGDITVSSSGTVLSIDADTVGSTEIVNDAITFAKINSGAIASQAEAEAGTATDKLMTPERTAQAIAANIPAASGQLLETIIYSCPSQTVTISNADPAVVTTVAQNRPEDGCPVRFTTTGTLPAGLSTGVTYWVVNSSGTTFNVAATKGGTAIATTDAGSGTHTCLNAPYEKATNNPSFIEVTVVGGSGGMNNNGANGAGAGAGGALKIIQNADLSSSETVTSGVAGTNGINGGTSSFGSHCSATGGESGLTSTPDGGEGTGGDINVRGMGAQVNPRYGAMSAFGLSRGAGDDIDSNLNGEQGLVIIREYS